MSASEPHSKSKFEYDFERFEKIFSGITDKQAKATKTKKPKNKRKPSVNDENLPKFKRRSLLNLSNANNIAATSLDKEDILPFLSNHDFGKDLQKEEFGKDLTNL